jgi:hypothetical protein
MQRNSAIISQKYAQKNYQWKRGRSLFFNLDVMTLKEPLDKIGMLFNKPKSRNVQSFQPQTTHNVL